MEWKITVHVGVKFQCNQCDYKASQQGDLKTHKVSGETSYPQDQISSGTIVLLTKNTHEVQHILR